MFVCGMSILKLSIVVYERIIFKEFFAVLFACKLSKVGL
mgnify:FL=1